MLIDDLMPDYQIRSRYGAVAKAPASVAYAQLLALDLRDSWTTRWLLRLRGIPENVMTLKGMQTSMFIRLGEVPGRELVLGIVGRFWRLSGQLHFVPADEFRNFARPGLAKAAWNFSLESIGQNQTRLFTETRVSCPDETSLKRFRRYWAIVGPFSGWTRKEMLRIVKQRAEEEASSD